MNRANEDHAQKGIAVPRTYVIDGNAIHDIPSFYAEINRVFAEEAASCGGAGCLDSLNDMLHGVHGTEGDDSVELIWLNMDKNTDDLGFDVTKTWLEDKLKTGRYSTAALNSQLEELMNGTGDTYFEMVRDVISCHEQIKVRKG